MLSRRSFLQMISAAMAASTLGVRGQIAQQDAINWNLWTDWNLRYDLTSPWSKDEMIYATDSRKIICLPGDYSGDGEAKVPDVGKLPWSEFDLGGWRTLGKPQIDRYGSGDFTWSPCFQCYGVGRVGDINRCQNCNGDLDEYVSPEGYLLDGCQKCHAGWVGGKECPRCHGTRYETEGEPTAEYIASMPFCQTQMMILRTLGDLDVRVVDQSVIRSNEGGDCGVLLFRGGRGVRGILMGLAT